MQTYEKLVNLARMWIEEGWQKGRASVVDDMHAPDFIDHDPGDRAEDREAFKQGIIDLYESFPDFYGLIDVLVVDIALSEVAIRWHASGTHKAPFLGVSPTGKQIHFKGIEIIRIEDGLIIERWGEWDEGDLIRQLKNE